MTTTNEFRILAKARSYRRIAAALVQLEKSRGVLDLDELGGDPEAALHGNVEVTVEYDTNPRQGCSVFGYYKPNPKGQSLIFVHPSLSQSRDDFTILHELGHHVQRQHDAWAEVLFESGHQGGRLLEERVADAFAAEILIPADAIPGSGSWLSAEALSEVFGRVRASRAAVAMRAIEIAPDNEIATVLVVDSRGRVHFARSSSDEVFAPARGLVQPGIAKLVSEAQRGSGRASGPLSQGLQAKSGWTQSDLFAEVSLDYTGLYAFAVIRLKQGFGVAPTWQRADEVECSREACGHVFQVTTDIEHCELCSAPKCPECTACDCEPEQAEFCLSCTLVFSVAERKDPAIHVCL